MNEQKFLLPSIAIPLEGIDQPFAQIIHAIQTSTIKSYRSLDEIEFFLFKHYLNGWDTAFHWAIKLFWNTKHKIPGGQTHIRAAKPLGRILACEIELCIRCQGLLGHKKTGYYDAATWFGALYTEHLKCGLNNLFEITINGGGKKTAVLRLRHILKALKEEENPFDAVVEPCLYHLIDCSLQLAKKSNSFRKEYWLPYIRALSTWTTHLDKNEFGHYQNWVYRVKQRRERLFLQICKPLGSGKGLRVLLEKEVVP